MKSNIQKSSSSAPDKSSSAKESNHLLVDLALQGGGAHGAFTWGVLDRLLEEPLLRFDGISGTSAGAMNAAVMLYGYEVGGVEGAKAQLELFWRKVSEVARLSPLQRGPLDVLLGNWGMDLSPSFMFFNMAMHAVSPYTMNIGHFNPLKGILTDVVDFDRLAESPIHLFVTATNVRSGKGRVFQNEEITADVLLASACLPSMFQAVEIDGVPYWDGGYSGNPTITPLVTECQSRDTIIVQINPVERANIPYQAGEIMNRLNEISFNATLLKELKMIALLRKLVNITDPESAQWAEMRVHRITSNKMLELGYSSKLNAEWPFLCMLRDEGRLAAEAFLQEHRTSLGKKSSLDLESFIKDSEG